MGRKNRNRGARSYTYTSFEELKNPTLLFDLSQGQFIKKTGFHYTKGEKSKADVRISLRNNQRGETYISFREDVGKIIKEHCGELVTAGLVSQGRFERLYIIGDKNGYVLSDNPGSSSTRISFVIPLGAQKESFMKYEGEHRLQYDEDNDEYYVTANQ